VAATPAQLRMTTAMIDFGLSGEHSRRRAGGSARNEGKKTIIVKVARAPGQVGPPRPCSMGSFAAFVSPESRLCHTRDTA
jgi:hypothetical protein